MTDLARDETWHEWRSGGLGASDVAPLVGLSSWSSPYSVWAAKVGLIAPSPTSDRQAIGHAMEGVLAQLFTERTGLHVAGEQSWCEHPELSWPRCTVDGFVYASPADSNAVDPFNRLALGGFEAKTDGRFGWPDGIPPAYQCQAQWSMWVTGLQRWWVGVMFAGFRFEVFEIARDDLDVALLVKAATAFWHDHVVTGVPPAIDASDATRDALATVYPDHVPGVTVGLDGIVEQLVRRSELKGLLKGAEVELDRIENEIRAVLGDAEVGTVAGVPALTYRTAERRDIKAAAVREAAPWLAAQLETITRYRVLRTVAPKKEKP